MRRRSRPEPDADTVAALEDIETIEVLSTYKLRLADPPVPGFTDDLDLSRIRKVCESNRGNPAAKSMLTTFEDCDGMRQEALHGQA